LSRKKGGSTEVTEKGKFRHGKVTEGAEDTEKEKFRCGKRTEGTENTEKE
jgi:hypothetical protein